MNFEIILKWISSHNTLILVFSILSFVLAIILIVALVVTINILPADYFLQEKKSSISQSSNIHFLLSIIKLILKNILGIILLLFGILMLFLPGQGILTIFISLLFLTFPGKWNLIQRLVSKKKIFESMNWIRRRFGKDELIKC